jgi:hypothetical protein
MAVNALEKSGYLYISELVSPMFVMYQLSLLQLLLLIGTYEHVRCLYLVLSLE